MPNKSNRLPFKWPTTSFFQCMNCTASGELDDLDWNHLLTRVIPHQIQFTLLPESQCWLLVYPTIICTLCLTLGFLNAPRWMHWRTACLACIQFSAHLAELPINATKPCAPQLFLCIIAFVLIKSLAILVS
jgi:hypothetical protein